MALTLNTDNITYRRECRVLRTLIHSWWKKQGYAVPLEDSLAVLTKLNIVLAYNPVTTNKSEDLGPNKMLQRMFTAVLFIIAKNWK